jgi:hypothetical protein
MSPGAPPEMGPAGGGAAAAVTAPGERVSINWIVGKWTDLLCFIGAAALGYGMFFLHAGLAMNMITIWFVWYMFLDSPHFFGTYARTYLDKEEWQQRRRLLIGSIGLLAVGPVTVILGYGLYALGAGWYKTPYLALVAFVSIWAYWHVVRQHYGIMALYKRKNKDSDTLDLALDQWVLYLGLLAPFVAFAVTNNEARIALGISRPLEAGRITNPYIRGQGWESLVQQLSMVAAFGSLLILIARQLVRLQRGLPLNGPKILFLFAVIPLHMVVCYHPASTTLALLGFSACVTIFHDMQYHAIVWYHQKNRMAKAGDERFEKYGMAARISRSFPVYMGCAVAMGVTLGLLGCVIDVNPGCFPDWVPLIAARSSNIYGNMTVNELFYGIFLGVLMHHYYVDQFIWRPSKDKNLQKDLKLTPGR